MMLKKMVSWIAALSIAVAAGIQVSAAEMNDFPDVLYEMDLSNADSGTALSELGLSAKNGAWEVVHDDSGSYLKSTAVTADLMVNGVYGKDYQIEAEYQQDSSIPEADMHYSGSDANNYMLKNTVYARSGDTLNSGTGFYKWIFTNPGQYSGKSFQGFFGGNTVVNNSYQSADDTSKVKANVKQNIKVSVRDKDEKNTLLETDLNQGAFSMPASHWHSGVSVSGKIGMEWKIVLGSKYNAGNIGYAVKIYKIKVTGKKPAEAQKDSTLSKESAPYEDNGPTVKDHGCVARISYYHGENYGFRLSYTAQDSDAKTATIPYDQTIAVEGNPDVVYGIEVNGVPQEYAFDVQPYVEDAN